MIKQKESQTLLIDLPIDDITLQAYKHCANDYFKGIGPFGSPFSFLSYGITYQQMLFLAKFSTEFMSFIFKFLSDNLNLLDKILNFLADAWLTEAEIKERILRND